jgi:hypothetical protein
LSLLNFASRASSLSESATASRNADSSSCTSLAALACANLSAELRRCRMAL